MNSTSWIDEFETRLDDLRSQTLLRTRHEVVPEHGTRIRFGADVLLAFCSNDYLGLANHPLLREAVHQAVERYGVGAGASPMVSGHSRANASLERELADAVCMPRALYAYAGYALNASIVSALVGAGDAIFSDALNHACLIDGARLSKASTHVYRHADLRALSRLLADSPAPRKLIVSDAVFSMDGDTADIPALLQLAERHDALLLLDDAHGFGVRGPQGRGSLAEASLCENEQSSAKRRVLYMATLGKALGVAGAFVAGPESLVEWLLQRTRSYIYATAPPALLAEAVRAALRLTLSDGGDRRRVSLTSSIAQLRDGLAAGVDDGFDDSGWKLLASNTAIQPLVVGDNRTAMALTQELRRSGLWVPAIRPPTVPEGTARLRIALSAAHDAADVDRLLVALRHAARTMAR